MSTAADVIRLIVYLYGAAALLCLLLALWLPKSPVAKLIFSCIVIVLFSLKPISLYWAYRTEAPKWKAEAEANRAEWEVSQALFKEACARDALIKIYRTVPDVEGIVLLDGIPTEPSEQEDRDPMQPRAAFRSDWTEDSFIQHFLWREAPTHNGITQKRYEITPDDRGLLTPNVEPDSRPGYGFVDVIGEEGQRERYRGGVIEKEGRDSGSGKAFIYTRWELNKDVAPGPAPRYGVKIEGHIIPEERQHWLASGTVRVLDLESGEVLGEMTQYSLSTGGGWQRAWKCPVLSSSANIRMFVDQVLIPKEEH